MSYAKQMRVALAFCLALIIGCNESATETRTDQDSPKGLLSIGLVPELNIFNQIERYEPIADYLSKKMGFNIRLRVFARHGDVVRAFADEGLDAAFVGSFAYVLAHANVGVQAIAREESMLGKSTSHGLIFVRKDRPIKDLNDLKGKIFVLVDRATTAGYLFPLAYFNSFGIQEPELFFGETYFSGTYQGAVYDVLDKKADAGATKDTVIKRLAEVDSRVKNELVFLARSSEVPDNCLVVRNTLDKAIKAQVKKILLNLHLDPDADPILRDFGAKRFVETSDHDYADLYRYLQDLGIDLSTYNNVD
jgi:phosphonate transport system substrate-binding protein